MWNAAWLNSINTSQWLDVCEHHEWCEFCPCYDWGQVEYTPKTVSATELHLHTVTTPNAQ